MEIGRLLVIRGDPCEGKWYCRHGGNGAQQAEAAVSSQTLCQHPPQTDRRCLMWGNLWIMDFHNRPFMISPSLKSALQSLSASILSFNWKKIYYSFPPSQVVLSIWVAQPPHLDSLRVPPGSSQEPDSSHTLVHATRAPVSSITHERQGCYSKSYIGVVPIHELI